MKRTKPESGIPPSYRATRRYTKVHLGFCLRFSTLIGRNRPRTAFRRWTQAVHQVAAIQVGRHRFLTCPYRFLTAKRQAKAKIFPRTISTTELPSNHSPLTFRNNQIQILQTSLTHATMAANVSQQDTNTHGTSLSHARTHVQLSLIHI